MLVHLFTVQERARPAALYSKQPSQHNGLEGYCTLQQPKKIQEGVAKHRQRTDKGFILGGINTRKIFKRCTLQRFSLQHILHTETSARASRQSCFYSIGYAKTICGKAIDKRCGQRKPSSPTCVFAGLVFFRPENCYGKFICRKS